MHTESMRVYLSGEWHSIRFNYDESSLRSEAISFFSARPFRLGYAPHIPDEIAALPPMEVRKHFESNSAKRLVMSLEILETDEISDNDLERLQYIDELKILKLLSNNITDAGLVWLSRLSNLEHLCVWSKKVTDQCLNYLPEGIFLHTLDMLKSTGISVESFHMRSDRFPVLQKRWPPGSDSYGDREFNTRLQHRVNKTS